MKVGIFLILVTLGVVLFLFFGSNNEGLVFLSAKKESAKKEKNVKPENPAQCEAIRPGAGNKFINGNCYAANNIPPGVSTGASSGGCQPPNYMVGGVCYKQGTVITPNSNGCPNGFEDKDGRGICTVKGPTLNKCKVGQQQPDGSCAGPPQVPVAAPVQPVVTSIGFGGKPKQPVKAR